MATSTYVATITTTASLAYTSMAAGEQLRTIRRLGEFLQACASGSVPSVTVDIQANGGTAVAAAGTVTISSGSGSITATINGVAIAITWATSDTNSATLLKNAINASVNALVAGLVTATSALGVVTVTAANKGKPGNTITLAASGTGATASGARLTAGADASAQALTF